MLLDFVGFRGGEGFGVAVGFRCQELLDTWLAALRQCGGGDRPLRVQEVWLGKEELPPV